MATQIGNGGLMVQRAARKYECGYEQRGAPGGEMGQNSMAYGSAGWKTTISVEFVAKPNESHRVHALVPAAIRTTLEGVPGFAGCAVMASSQEERLVTVLTFWQGDLTARAAAANSGWVCKLLERYMDHRLRVQTMRTQLAMAESRQGELEKVCVPIA